MLFGLNHTPSQNLFITDALSHYTPTFSPVSDEYRISDQESICYVEIDTDDSQ